MEEQHKEMLRNLINGVYDNVDAGAAAKHYQPGQLAHRGRRAAQPRGSTGAAPRPPGAAPAGGPCGPRDEGAPKINEVGVETLFGEDLISEKSLDEVILSYLAGEGDP